MKKIFAWIKTELAKVHLRVRWGYGALLAAYGFIEYIHPFKLFGSKFFGGIAVFVVATIALSLERRNVTPYSTPATPTPTK